MDNEIRIDDLCLDVSKSQGPVTMVKCHHLKGNQFWEYNQKVSEKEEIYRTLFFHFSLRENKLIKGKVGGKTPYIAHIR